MASSSSRSATTVARSRCRACSRAGRPLEPPSRTASSTSALPAPRSGKRSHESRRRARHRAAERARLSHWQRAVRRHSSRLPGAPAERPARADHGPDAHLRKPRCSRALRHARKACHQARPQDPDRLNPFLDFVIRALLLVPALLIAIPVHEMGHAAAAYFLGDRSVRYFGYFKPEPRRFLEPLGVVTVFVALVGWGRRVPIQSNRISTTGQKVIYELGGPAANLVVAIVLGTLLRVAVHFGVPYSFDPGPGFSSPPCTPSCSSTCRF